MSTLQLDEFKTRQRATWEAGDYSVCSPYIAEVGELVVNRAGITPGLQVLDVACGTGNAARPAARTGARVTGVDFASNLLAAGRSKAQAEGVEIDFREGDAENLPFEDGSFDRVLSTFGHMFAPRHQRTADEMARVCRSGGAIVFAAWAPDGSFGELSRAVAPFMPPPPDFASPPAMWGSEDHVRELFGPVARSFDFERQTNWIQWESLDAFADFFMSNFPPMVTAKKMLGDRFADLRAGVVDVWRRRNQATDGTLRLPQEYLVSVVRL